MRWKWLTVICLLAIFTGIAYRPILDSGMGIADPVMILLAWLALVDRISRVLIAITFIGLLRMWLGIGEIADTFLPLLGVIISVRLLRHLLDPYHPIKRFQIVVPALTIGVILQWALLTGEITSNTGLIVSGVLISLLFAALLLPILDLTAPLLRSARYPL